MIKVHKAATGTTPKRAKVDLSVAATRARTEAYLRKNQRMIESWWDINVDDDPAAAAALAAGGAMVGPEATKKPPRFRHVRYFAPYQAQDEQAGVKERKKAISKQQVRIFVAWQTSADLDRHNEVTWRHLNLIDATKRAIKKADQKAKEFDELIITEGRPALSR